MKILLVGSAGYIGSYLLKHLRHDGYEVTVCDQALPSWNFRYQDRSRDYLGRYDTVLWFAGHSSVKQCYDDPEGALNNNCLDLVAFRQRMRPDARLIFASTASLYSSVFAVPSSENTPIRDYLNSYDRSKGLFDLTAVGFLKNWIGLRMGTVCGISPNMRYDTVFNAMNRSAIQDRKVQIANPWCWRSLLFLEDLYAALAAILHRPQLNDGFFNLASWSGTIGDLGTQVALHYRAMPARLPDSTTYSFRLDCSKAMQLLDFRPSLDLPEQCLRFEWEMRTTP